MSIVPAIELGGSASGGGGASPTNGAGSIASDYAELIASGSNAFQASGAKTFVMSAGDLSLACLAQIGRVYQGVTITADMVAQNQALLNSIGTYCRANGITITVQAILDNAPANDWTYQWLNPAAKANLPITAVENVDEPGVSIPDTTANFAALAANETAIIKQIVAKYPTVQIGQWNGGVNAQTTADYFNAVDNATRAAGLPGISYIVADTSWNAPWVTSPTDDQSWLANLSALVHANNMTLTVLLDGINTDASNLQWTAQSEQHAAMLATMPGVTADALLIQTWQNAYPSSVLPVNQPTTLGNDAVEIAATYPLYENGLITAQGTVAISAPPDMIMSNNASTVPVSLNWGAVDAADGARVAVTLTDETGIFSALSYGTGTVSGSGSTSLVLDGNTSDIAAELESVMLTEPVSGPDSVDIEVFGLNGRIDDSQIAVLSAQTPISSGTETLNFLPTSAYQPWTAASATVTSHGIVSEVFNWNATDFGPAAGQYQIIKTDGLLEPLAESGVAFVKGVLKEPLANPVANSSASLPFMISNWVSSAFDPSTQMSVVNVSSTAMTYGSYSGNLETIVDTLEPANPTALITGGSVPNYFSFGGYQITQENSGDNPNWQSNWNAGLASVATTFGSNGQVLEQVFQGGPSEPYFSLTNVFNPSTGGLWEQIQTAPPPSPFGSFVTGDEYITQFNDGSNPNWDYRDWGAASQVTVTWQDYYVIAVASSPPVATGLGATQAYISDTSLRPAGSGSSASSGGLTGNVLTPAYISATNAAIVAAEPLVVSVAISDSAANVVANLAALETIPAAAIGAITLTDSGTPSLSLTAAQFAAATPVLAQITSPYALAIAAVTAATAASTAATAHVSSVAISDSAANVVANLAVLETIPAAALGAITLTDSGTPSLSLTATQFAAATPVLAQIASPYALAIAAVTAATAASTAATAHVSSVAISDSAANVVANLAALETVPAAALGAITLTDSGTPSLSLTATQFAAATPVLAQIASPYALAIAAVTAATAASTAATAHVSSVAISDSAANVVANLAALETVPAAALGAITLTDSGTPSLSLTATQFAAATPVLAQIASPYALAIAAVTAATAASTAATAHVSSVAISDSAANVVANLAALETVPAAALGAITLIDTGTPSLSLTATQFAAATPVLARIVTPYNVAVTVTNGQQIDAVAATAGTEVILGGINATTSVSGARTIAIVSGDNDKVTVTTGAEAALVGANDTATIGDTATMAFLAGSNDSVTATTGAEVVLSGTNDTATISGTATKAFLYGSSGSVTAMAGAEVVLGGTNNAATISGPTTTAFVNGEDDSVMASNGATVILADDNTGATISSGAVAWVHGASDTVTMGDNALAFIYGTKDTVAVQATGGTQTVGGFNLSSGDKLDLIQILTGTPIARDFSNIGNYVSVVDEGSDAVVSITGHAGHDTITFTGAGVMDLASLISHGALAIPMV